jgi:hypothetical protein
MSVFVGLVDIRDILLLRALQQGEYVGDVGTFLGAVDCSVGVVVVPPALQLHYQ